MDEAQFWSERSLKDDERALGGLPTLRLSNEGVGIRMSLTVTSSSAALVGYGDTLLISNVGDNDAHLRFSSTASPTATTACVTVFSGTQVTYRQPGANYVAGITSTSTTTIQISRGTGN